MSTMVSRAVTAIVDLLTAAPAVAHRVERIRMRPLQQAVGTAVVVRPLASKVIDSELTAVPYYWATQIAVECYCRVPPGQAADQAVDPILAAVYARLAADINLSGSAIAIDPIGIQYDYDAEAEQVVCAVLQINVRQTTAGPTL